MYSTPAQQVIRSAKNSVSSNRHFTMVEGIKVEQPRIKHHAMITRLDALGSTLKIGLRSRSVIKSEYKYEHLKSGL